MMNNSVLQPVILLTTTMPTISNEFAQYGFLGILLAILLWYAFNSYRADEKRDIAREVEKKEIICRYEKLLESERERYSELSKEILIIYKSNVIKSK